MTEWKVEWGVLGNQDLHDKTWVHERDARDHIMMLSHRVDVTEISLYWYNPEARKWQLHEIAKGS